jgi:hypothetical protein
VTVPFDVGAIRTLIIAGWTGRDPEHVERHIRELEAIGVRRPTRTPEFYRVSPSLLSLSDTITAPNTSTGEVEFVLLNANGALHVTVGSDHTDRELERQDITAAKEACGKPVASTAWRYDDVASHWDDLEIRSFVEIDGQRRLYQEGRVAAMLAPPNLIARYEADVGPFTPGTAIFGGTLVALGPMEAADVFEIELTDPVLRRTLRHRYSAEG